MFGNERQYTPEQGRIRIYDTSRPFYLRSVAENITPAVSVITFTPMQGGAPGGTCELDATLHNTSEHNAVFAISGKDILSRKEYTLAPNSSKDVSVPVNISRQDYGLFMFETQVDISLADGSKHSVVVPASVNAAYVIPGAGHDPAKVILDTRAAVNEMTYDPHIPQWRGPEDLSCEFFAVHDGKGIEFNFHVTDDKHFAKASGMDIWKNDSIQLAIKAGEGAYTEITIADSPDGATVWRHVPAKTAGKLDVPVSVVHRQGKTLYKVYMPFDKLGIDYASGNILRMAFIVNEDDGLGRIRWIEWFKGIGDSKDPSKFGWVILQ